MKAEIYSEAFQIGDLVRISPNSQLIEHDLDGSKTIRGHDSTVRVRFNTDTPVLGVVFRPCSVVAHPSYLGVVVENQRWFIRNESVTGICPETGSHQSG